MLETWRRQLGNNIAIQLQQGLKNIRRSEVLHAPHRQIRSLKLAGPAGLAARFSTFLAFACIEGEYDRQNDGSRVCGWRTRLRFGSCNRRSVSFNPVSHLRPVHHFAA